MIGRIFSMSRYRLIAFDMDGTLLDSQKQIDPYTLEAIKRADEAGKIVALSTGRCMPELKEYMGSIPGLKYIIGDSGAYIYEVSSQKPIYRKYIAPEIIQSIFNQTEGMDILFQIHSDAAVVERDKQLKMEYYQIGVYRKLFDEIMLKVDDIREYFKKNQPPVYKFNLFSPDTAQREHLKNMFARLPIQMCHSEVTALEISPLGISKGTGLTRLCEYLNIPVRETIAVGDADNDLDILRTAGLSVAMANGNDNVKRAAKVIVSDNDHGGCREAIEKYLL